ncbi:hypothetical protein N9C08_01315 [Rubripirellula sp.]|nr:hypothetical protein [Rubripirellula sp.]
MSRQAILVDQYTISFMEATVRHGRVEVDAFIRLPRGKFDRNGQPGPEQFGGLLREELNRLGWKTREAILVLSSPMVIERSINLPKTSKATLPNVVQLQVEAMPLLKMQDPVIDYSVQKKKDSGLTVDVTISSQVSVHKNVESLNQAGLSIASVTSSAQSLKSSLALFTKDVDEPMDLLVVASDRRVEVIAFEGSSVVATHSEFIYPSNQDRGSLLPQVVDRCVKAIQRQTEHYLPRRALLVLDDEMWGLQLADHLQEKFETECQSLDCRSFFKTNTNSVSAKRSEFLCAESVILAGAILSQKQNSQYRINLLKPKRVKRRLIQKGLVAALAASALAFVGNQWLTELDRERITVETRWAELRSQVDELAAQNKKSDRLLRIAEVVESWQAKSVLWVPELNSLQKNLPERNEAYLRQLVLRSDQDTEFPHANAMGFAREQSDVMSMNQRLSGVDSRYELEPRPFFYSDRTAPFVHQFELDLSLNERVSADDVLRKEVTKFQGNSNTSETMQDDDPPTGITP